MSLFAIADLHLSTLASTNKSMEVFGRRWSDYMEKIEKNWRAIVEEDDTVRGIPVLVDDRGRPDRSFCSDVGGHIEYISRYLEAFKVFRGHKIKVELIVKGQRVGNVHINRIAVNTGFGIGIPAVYNGIVHKRSPCIITGAALLMWE